MLDPQFPSVKRDAARKVRACSIFSVAQNRKAPAGKLNANLMLPARFQADFDQRMGADLLNFSVMQSAFFAGFFASLVGVTSTRNPHFSMAFIFDNSVNALIFQWKNQSFDQCEINFFHAALAKLLIQPRRRLGGSGKQHHAGNGNIQPTDNAQVHSTGLVVLGFDVVLGAGQEGLFTFRQAHRRQSGGLDHGQQMIVFVKNFQGNAVTDYRSCWVWNGGKQSVSYTLEADRDGKGEWTVLKTIAVPAGKSTCISFDATEGGEWVRVKADKDTYTTVSFNYSQADNRSPKPAGMFAGLSSVENPDKLGGLLYGLGDNRRALGLLANETFGGEAKETGYYEMSDKLELIKKEDTETADFIRKQFAIPQQVVTVEEGSVLIVDDHNRRWRLPLGNRAFNSLTGQGKLRICREVATERDLFHCLGTFYELPAENADGYAKIRPVATHNYQINDYASYRGMLVLTGVEPEKGKDNPHIIVSNDGKAAVWAGVIDDLWQLGKPIGYGGPWTDSKVMKGVPSDPYLFGFYDKKELSLSHKSVKSITFTVEFDPTGNGDWMSVQSITVQPGETYQYTFPREVEARWIRLVSDQDTQATAWLEYE